MPKRFTEEGRYMRIGLVIGKFLPLHNGHVGLIEFALKQCDLLRISMVTRDEDVISPETRKAWILSVFKDDSSKIQVDIVNEKLPRTDGHTPEVFDLWADFFSSKYSDVQVIISSESYAKALSEWMSVDHVFFDPERVRTNISASEILKNPLTYKSFLPEIVNEYFMNSHSD